jgi:hypothetical protein
MYQTTGEYRAPRLAEPYLYQWRGQWVISQNSLGIITEPKLILQKIRVATTIRLFIERCYLGCGFNSFRILLTKNI